MIAIIDYDAGNLRSVQKAFEIKGFEAQITSDKKTIDNASHIVLPGVGSFNAGMQALKERNLVEVIYKQIEKGKQFLGICLGMQMLFSKSFEGGEVEGLSVIEGSVEKFVLPKEFKIPHMGWNNLEFAKDDILENVKNGADVYFVHSYFCNPKNKSDVLTQTEYGIKFCSAIKKDNVYGFQFHPEKSGEVGIKMIENFAKLKG